jgi:hypothetical protein
MNTNALSFSSLPVFAVVAGLVLGGPLTGCASVEEVRQRIEQEGEERTDAGARPSRR